MLIIAAAVANVADTAAAQGALRGMGAVSAGLIAATGIKMMTSLKTNPVGRWAGLGIAAVTFVTVAWLRVPLAWVLLGLGPLSCVWAWHCLQVRSGS